MITRYSNDLPQIREKFADQNNIEAILFARRANYLPKWASLPCADWPILSKEENYMYDS